MHTYVCTYITTHAIHIYVHNVHMLSYLLQTLLWDLPHIHLLIVAQYSDVLWWLHHVWAESYSVQSKQVKLYAQPYILHTIILICNKQPQQLYTYSQNLSAVQYTRLDLYHPNTKRKKQLAHKYSNVHFNRIVLMVNHTRYSAYTIYLQSHDNYTHVSTSSPGYPQSNSEMERAVKTIKNLLNKNDDPFIGLMIYCSTSLHNGFSCSEFLMNKDCVQLYLY